MPPAPQKTARERDYDQLAAYYREWQALINSHDLKQSELKQERADVLKDLMLKTMQARRTNGISISRLVSAYPDLTFEQIADIEDLLRNVNETVMLRYHEVVMCEIQHLIKRST
jgi:hypothetical protein